MFVTEINRQVTRAISCLFSSRNLLPFLAGTTNRVCKPEDTSAARRCDHSKISRLQPRMDRLLQPDEYRIIFNEKMVDAEAL
jgi:hypothetical protein